MSRISTAAALVLGSITPALAHQGDHSRITPLDLAQHLAEPSHLAVLAAGIAVAVGTVSWRRSSRAAARTKPGRRQ